VREELQLLGRQDSSAAAVLARVRRRVLIGGDRDLRQMPERAQALEAVRLLTVHAAKGLEFSAVHVAGLAARVFPADRQPEPCPPPPGLIEGVEDIAAAHRAEEQCLFFVAISRARDALTLAYPAHASRQARKPSPFLVAVDRWIQQRRNAVSPRSPAPAADKETGETGAGASSHAYTLEEIERYLACPRRYFYERRLCLPATPPENPYYRSQRVLRDALRAFWRGETSPDHARHKFDELWKRDGPHDHAYAGHLRQEAEAVFVRIVERLSRGTLELPQEQAIPIAQSTMLRLSPDAIVHDQGERAWLWLRFRRSGKAPDRISAALAHACRAEGIEVRCVSLETGEVEPVVTKPAKIERILDEYRRAAGGIARGHFPATPEEPRRCPTCPYYFICPA
jgi:DNA helicase-2/ATP-dependent DNA helicase PcrA